MASRWHDTVSALEQAILDAPRVPLTGKVMFDEKDLLGWLSRLKKDLPAELREMDRVLKERDHLIEEARLEAQALLNDAKAHVARLVQDSTIVEEARREADALMHEAEEKSSALTSGAREYADQVLGQLEAQMERVGETIRRGRAELQSDPVKKRA